MLPNNFSQIAEQIQRQNNRSLKELFKNDIRGSFLIDIKYRVLNAIAEKFFELYDLRWSDERMVTGIGPEPEYDICKHIVGVHKANTIFLTADEKSKIEKDENYKTKLTKQVAEQIFLRGYGSAYFRHKPIMSGERFNYYPVPYVYLAEPYLNCMQNFLLCVFIPNCLPRTKNSLILKHFKRAATKYFPMNLINCSQTAKIKMSATRLNICIMVLLIKFRTITIL